MTVKVGAGVPVRAAPAAAVSVSVDVAPAVTVVGTNAAVTPAGRSWMLSAIVSAVPLVDAVVIVYVAVAPRRTLFVGGVAVIVKSLAAQFGNFTDETCVS